MKYTAITLAMAAASASAFRLPLPARDSPASKRDVIELFRETYVSKVSDTNSAALPWLPAPVIGEGNIVGDAGFDPLGLSDKFDLVWLREAELKHGRICMLAFLGLLVPASWQIYPAEYQETNPFEAFSKVPQFGLAQIFLFAGLVEVLSIRKLFNSSSAFDDGLSPKERENIRAGKVEALAGQAKSGAKVGYFSDDVVFEGSNTDPNAAGDIGFDPYLLKKRGDYRLAELKHARVAMVAVLALYLQNS